MITHSLCTGFVPKGCLLFGPIMSLMLQPLYADCLSCNYMSMSGPEACYKLRENIKQDLFYDWAEGNCSQGLDRADRKNRRRNHALHRIFCSSSADSSPCVDVFVGITWKVSVINKTANHQAMLTFIPNGTS